MQEIIEQKKVEGIKLLKNKAIILKYITKDRFKISDKLVIMYTFKVKNSNLEIKYR